MWCVRMGMCERVLLFIRLSFSSLNPPLMQRKTPHLTLQKERGSVSLKTCVCVHLTIDSHAISWWIFIRSRLCDMGYISPSMVLFILILSFLSSLLVHCFSSCLVISRHNIIPTGIKRPEEIFCVGDHVFCFRTLAVLAPLSGRNFLMMFLLMCF